MDREEINQTAKKGGSDRYYKKFHTYDHLVTTLMRVLSGCSSLREISGLFLACKGRIGYLGLKDFPRRSTFAEANSKRSSEIFAKIYQKLYRGYRSFLPDSRKSKSPVENLYIVDSTTISLFSDVLRGFGVIRKNERRHQGTYHDQLKGGCTFAGTFFICCHP